uniref:Transmembrane protein n=1 Tax=Steinernema glaseri TaxID=37863 RepID=A0A1I8AMX4_9BILA
MTTAIKQRRWNTSESTNSKTTTNRLAIQGPLKVTSAFANDVSIVLLLYFAFVVSCKRNATEFQRMTVYLPFKHKHTDAICGSGKANLPSFPCFSLMTISQGD